MRATSKTAALVNNLAKLDELIEQHRATLSLLELERLRVRSKLAAAGEPIEATAKPRRSR